MDLSRLISATLDDLEAIYAAQSDEPLEVPEGAFRGTLLGWLPVPEGQHPLTRPIIWVGFDLVPFGVDFTMKRWFFGTDRSPRLGRFTPVVGSSRWRDTETIRLHYERSRLPGAIRTRLYDEIKPLSSDLCLGLGGINAERGEGEQFFFALTKISERS